MAKVRMLAPSIRTMDTRTVQPAARTNEPLYTSKPWRDLMKAIIAKRGRRCEQCGRTETRIFGDHMVELKDGGAPLSASNIRLLCGACHTTKTIAERAKRMAKRY